MINKVLRICASAILGLASAALLGGCVSVEAEDSFPETLADTGATTTQSEPSRHFEKPWAEFLHKVSEFAVTSCGAGNVKSVSASFSEYGQRSAASFECGVEHSDQEPTE